MNEQEIILATIGDLEVSRRQLIMEIQARDEIISDLQARLAVYEPEQTEPANGKVNMLEEVEST